MTTTIGSEEHVERSVVAPPSLLMAMELGKYEWKVGFTTGLGQRPRRRTIRTDHWQRLADEITTAKHRLGLAPDAPVTSCYEAGPDGFWVHRYLTTLGVTNLVVDSSSIEVSRRAPPREDRSRRCGAIAGAVAAVHHRRAHRPPRRARAWRRRRAAPPIGSGISRDSPTAARAPGRSGSWRWRADS